MKHLLALLADPDFLEDVSCTKEYYPAGAMILRENDEARDLFLIAEGEVEVGFRIAGCDAEIPAKLARLDKDQVFGELSIFDAGLRTAEVRAVSDCEIFKVNGPDLKAYLEQHPDKGYFVILDMYLRLINIMRENDVRTKTIMQMYLFEHQDEP